MLDLVLAVVLPVTILAQEELPNEVSWRKTLTSTHDPSPGHIRHEADIVLPPRTDHSMWVGDVTWTTSKPAEVVEMHGYNDSGVTTKTASQFGEPLTALFGERGEVKFDSGTRVDSGTTHLAGNVFAFSTLSYDPFTVTYTVNAAAE